jgi:UPF0755 protein
MRFIVSLIHFIYNLFLFSIAAVALVLIAALLYAQNIVYDNAQLLITTGGPPGRTLLDAEARALYPILEARAAEINTPLSNDPGLVAFTIADGETAYAVAEKLQAIGLIHDAQLFGQLLRYNGIDTKLKTGDYILRRNMTLRQVGAALYWGRSALMTLTIPPGWRMEQLAEHLAATGTMDGSRFLLLAQRGNGVAHYLLGDRPAGQSYEGYLFPGTYYLSDQATPEELIGQMLDSMAGQLPQNIFELARQRGLTFYEVLILASIVEREAALAAERPVIASVYLNRLHPQSPETHLRADPTVQYAMGYQSATEQWWKTPVSLDEYALVDSPYNTYLHPGLPPGPIASPRLESIMAVLYPAETDYLYFVCQRPHCEGGSHAFARTYEEHLQNVAVYWGQ